MKASSHSVFNTLLYNRALEWGKLITITGGAQILVQGLSLIGGILVIRLLPTQEYAVYTLANTMLGTMTILADGGIAAGVMSQGGKVWQDREKLGAVLSTGLELREKFAIGSFLFAAPALLYLLRHHGATWTMSLLIIGSLIPAFTTALSGTLLAIAPKLRQDILPLQKNQVGTNLGRLALLSASLFWFPWAFIAILCAGLPQIWSNINLRKVSFGYADWAQRPDPVIRQYLLAFVKRILPGSIYYCLSGQITIWIISILGSTTAVAQVGALSRLAMILGVLSVLFSTLISPRFARLPDKAGLLLSRYLQIQMVFIILCALVIGSTWIFPEQILFILGKGYSNLKAELVLSVANSCLGLIGGASFAICTSRGWVINPLISIPVTICAIITGLFIFNVSTLKGVFLLNIFVSVAEVIMYFVYILFRISEVNRSQHIAVIE
jgi:O-antigen/teichoic acid export membrane protein